MKNLKFQHPKSKNMERPKAIFMLGPTASGKTDLALHLVELLPVLEVISVDSAMVYQGMDIGTAKPSAVILSKVPHHLIDIRKPGDIYSVADFVTDALDLMRSISSKGKVPLLVGGTMLYFKSLLTGLAALPEVFPEVRDKVRSLAREEGGKAVYAALKLVDPVSAARLHPNDTQRITRALEVCWQTSEPFSSWLYRHSGQQTLSLTEQIYEQFEFEVLSLGILPLNRAKLHEVIEARFKTMLELGFLEEVRRFYHEGQLSLALPSMRCVGYRQAWEYLAGEWDYNTMVAKALAATRQLAKRQLTWLKTWPSLTHLYCGDTLNSKQAHTLVASFLR